MENAREDYPADYTVVLDNHPPSDVIKEEKLRILDDYSRMLQPILFSQLSPFVVDALETYYCEYRKTPFMKGFLPDATAPGRLLNLGVRFTLDEAKQFVRRLLKDDFTDDYLESPKYGRPVVLLNHVKWYLEDMLYDEDSELYQFRKLVTFVSTPSHQQHKPACGVLTLHPRVSWPYIQSQTGNAQKVIDDVFARVKATLGCNEMELQWHFSTYEFSPHWRHNGPWKPFDAEKVLGPWADFYHGPGQGLIVNDENLVPY